MILVRHAVVLLLLTMLVACTDDGESTTPISGPAPVPGDDPGEASAPPSLNDTSWQLESYSTDGRSFVPRVRATPYLLLFSMPGGALADFSMTLADGCGNLEGDYRVVGDALITENVGNTDSVVSCSDQPVGDPLADAFLTGFFTNVSLAFEIEDVVLTLTASSGESARFVERGASLTGSLEERLVGPRWMLSHYVSDAGEMVQVSAEDRSSYTIRFSVSSDDTGIVRRSLGGTNVCNAYGGDYALADGALLLGDVSEDAAACDDAASPVAATFSRVLFDTMSPPMVAFDDDELVLTSGANESLRFTDGLVAGDEALARVFDTPWRLSAFSTGADEPFVAAVPEPETVFELVSGTEIVNGTPGCIDRFGYTVEDATVTFAEIPGTGPDCDVALAEDADAYARQVGFVQRAFRGGLAIAFDDYRLELRDDAGAVLTFER